MLSGEATHTDLIVFGFNQSGFETTIYRTRGGHANTYTTDAVGPKGEGTQLEMPVPSQGHYGFQSFPIVDWFCLFI